METKYYIPELGIDGTCEELLRWANHYTADYTDEALKKIAEIAKGEGKDERIPLLLIKERRLIIPYILKNK